MKTEMVVCFVLGSLPSHGFRQDKQRLAQHPKASGFTTNMGTPVLNDTQTNAGPCFPPGVVNLRAALKSDKGVH